MILYDLRCTCGWFEDDVLMPSAKRGDARCPECAGELHNRPRVNLTGAVPVKAYGQTFANDRAADRHAAEYAPGAVTLDQDAAKRFAMKKREDADQYCRRMGYVDMDDRLKHVRQINAERKSAARGERKPFSMPR